ncbi:hypothetical protein PTSG_11555 [Salpingoeca rosetta]|uniref:Uncharacterized protein n=1 Tax=Salpingoeca rosetta (strain ATCC 50818 / BSB-021) TaxID=946362 RepID=F2TVP4_SALR5|nr:uncharacterized protein PTSG_11555 [Salpingoeca rosetta]EGD72140.1 hypothetical protein PTSG_11555 [Salpingoeca rosetta]|eukprot:XP_004998712.1 hypothetical protein PTSG_11555 [Salpingoeca rosetta]
MQADGRYDDPLADDSAAYHRHQHQYGHDAGHDAATGWDQQEAYHQQQQQQYEHQQYGHQQQSQQQEQQPSVENTWLANDGRQTLQEQLIQRYHQAASMQHAAEIQQQAALAHQREWYAQQNLEAHFAAAVGDAKMLKFLCSQRPRLINKQDDQQKTPLMYAVVNNHTDAVNMLIRARVRLNTTDAEGLTALHHAVIGDHLPLVKTLLGAGAKPSVRDANGRTPLHHATRCSNIKCAMELLKAPIKNYINAKDGDQMTPLHWACYYRQPQHVAMLLLRGASEDALDVDKKTPLHWAAQNGDPMCVTYLLESKSAARINQRDKQGLASIHLAAAAGHHNVLKVLCRVPSIKIDAADPNGRTALHWAAAACQDKATTTLLSFGAHPCKTDKMGQTPLAYALAREAPASLMGPLSEPAIYFPRTKTLSHTDRETDPSLSPAVRRHASTPLGTRLTRQSRKADLKKSGRSKTEPMDTAAHSSSTRDDAKSRKSRAARGEGQPADDHNSDSSVHQSKSKGRSRRSSSSNGGGNGGGGGSYAAMHKSKKSPVDVRADSSGRQNQAHTRTHGRSRSNSHGNHARTHGSNGYSSQTGTRGRSRRRSVSKTREEGGNGGASMTQSRRRTARRSQSRGNDGAGDDQPHTSSSGGGRGDAYHDEDGRGDGDGHDGAELGRRKAASPRHLSPSSARTRLSPSREKMSQSHKVKGSIADTRNAMLANIDVVQGDRHETASPAIDRGDTEDNDSVSALKQERDAAVAQATHLQARVRELERERDRAKSAQRRVDELETKLASVMRQLAAAEREKDRTLEGLRGHDKRRQHTRTGTGRLPAINSKGSRQATNLKSNGGYAQRQRSHLNASTQKRSHPHRK